MAPSNSLPVHGNEKTMNLNSLVLANIQASPYFKVYLYDLKTYHQVVDEIYYKVTHLEPWEKGSRNTAGQTGMCGGVRGVGTGGIVSSSFCLLYKLFTLKLTRKQLIGICTHTDSPYIRGLGLMYIRFTQPPQDLWEWYEPYLDDDEEVDVKAGGGHIMTIGDMCVQLLTRLEWYSTLFPRIPAPVQKVIERNLLDHRLKRGLPALGGSDRDGPGPVERDRRPGRDGAAAAHDDRRDSRSRGRSPDGGANGAPDRRSAVNDRPLPYSRPRSRSPNGSTARIARSGDYRAGSRSEGDRIGSRSRDDRIGSRSRDDVRSSISRDDIRRLGSRDDRDRGRGSRDDRVPVRPQDDRYGSSSRSHGERRRSRSRDGARRSRSNDKVRNSGSREERRRSRSRDRARRSRSNDKVRNSGLREERRRSRSRDRARRSRSNDKVRSSGSREERKRSRSRDRVRDERCRSRSREKNHRR